jgi:MATE family multidrug resistance protein
MSKQTVAPPTLRRLVIIAVPMVVSQASETIMLFVDRLFLSWLGKVHIAASMSGGLSAFVFAALFAGTVGYTNALVAQYWGAGRRERCVQAVAQGIYLSILFVPALLLLIPVVENLFIIAGHTERQIELEYTYFRILMLGAVFVLLRQTLAGFFLGIGKTRVVMAANVTGMVVNIPLNYILIFGKLGFPALGIRGAAIATIIGSGVIFAVLLASYLAHPMFREFGPSGGIRLRGELMGRLLRFGFPVGLELFLNVFAFNVFVQLMHSMGEDVAAAVTITFNYDMVAFIPMIGLGVAVTAMVGQQMGAGKPDGAHRATMLALRVGYSYAAVMMALFVFGAPALVRLFAGGMGPGDQNLLALSEAMVRLAAIYTLADITQLVFSGALRGAGDTRAVMLISVIAHWIVAVAAVILIRVIGVPPLSMWVFFIGFVIVLGAAIFLRYRSGAWRKLSVIEESVIEAETHRPKVAVEAEWM